MQIRIITNRDSIYISKDIQIQIGYRLIQDINKKNQYRMPGQQAPAQEQFIRPTKNNNDHSPNVILMPDGNYTSTIFTFKSPAYQNQANMIYQEKVQYEISTNAVRTGKTFKFKSQQERILALIGRYQQAPNS